MGYELSRLPNGLRVLTIPMIERDSVAVAIWVRAGGRCEAKRITGISHFLEHMLFKGTRTRSTRQIKEEIEGVGGILNAFTSEESTCYFAKLLKEHYGQALEVLADMVNHATLRSGDLAKERTVILEEIKMYRDIPSHHVHDIMGELLWPDHSLGRPLVGNKKSVTAMGQVELAAYKKKYYQPANLLVVVAGPVGHDEVLEHAESLFNGKTGRRVPPLSRIKNSQRVPRVRFVERGVEQTHVVLGFPSFSRYHPDRFALAILSMILGGNMSSRLFEEIREKRGLAYEIKTSLNFYQDTGAQLVSAGVESRRAVKAVRLILQELKKMKARPVREGELRRAKDYFMSQLYLGIEDTLDHLLWAGDRVVYSDELPDRHRIRQRIEAVTARDVQRVAKQIFKTAHLNLAMIGPLKPKGQTEIRNSLEV